MFEIHYNRWYLFPWLQVGGAAVFGLGIWLRVDPNAFKHLRILQVNQNDQLIQVCKNSPSSILVL